MKNKKIMSLLAMTLLSTSILMGCGKTGNIDFSSSETLTEFKNEVYRYSLGAQEKYTADDFTTNLTKFIEKLDDSEKEEYITYYVQGLYTNANGLSDKLNLLGYEMEDVITENNLEDYTYKTFSKLSDNYATIKGFVKEVEAKGFFLSRNVETDLLTITVELDDILEKYGQYMSESLKAYYQLNNYENKTTFIKDDTIDIEEVVNRIVKIEDGIEVDKNSDYKHIDKWISSYDYYYNILFGSNHDYFLSSGYYKEDVVNKYKELAEKYKDREIGKNLASMVEVLEANNNKNTTDVSGKAEEFINAKLTANDSEIQNAIDELNSEVDIEDIADKLGISVEDLMGTSDSTDSTDTTEEDTTQSDTTDTTTETNN